MAVKNDNIIITAKDAKTSKATQGEAGNGQTSNTSKNENLPTFALNLTNFFTR